MDGGPQATWQVDSSLNMSGEPEVEIGNVAASTNFGVHR